MARPYRLQPTAAGVINEPPRLKRHVTLHRDCFEREVSVPDILHDFPIKAPLDRVFQAVSTPEGLDRWWTKRSEGKPVSER